MSHGYLCNLWSTVWAFNIMSKMECEQVLDQGTVVCGEKAGLSRQVS